MGLREVLSRSSEFGAYAGLKVDDATLEDDVLDKEVSVRFQTTSLPVEKGERSSLEFAPEAYNYNTVSDDDPRNLIFLCTSQGLAIQQDGEGSKMLYHHAVVDDGTVKRYWLEAESSKHKVGGAQVESKEEKDDAIKRGKATSSVIGVKGIGTRFNVLMTIQIPLEQQKRPEGYVLSGVLQYDFSDQSHFFTSKSCSDHYPNDLDYMLCSASASAPMSMGMGKVRGGLRGGGRLLKKMVGKSSAARVSRGSE